jgi:hypothetical protein
MEYNDRSIRSDSELISESSNRAENGHGASEQQLLDVRDERIPKKNHERSQVAIQSNEHSS